MNLTKKIEQRKKAKRVAERNKKMKIATVGMVAGVTAGALGGILLAPKAGKDTISDIKDKSQQVANTVSEKSQLAKARVNENVNESKKRIKEYLQNKKNKELNLENTEEEIDKLESSETVEA